MAYQRIKKITEEERAARSTLKKMGVSEYELNRLYDANYKARTRGKIAGAEYGESLNLNWKNVLQGARQAVKQGKTVSEYVRSKTASYKTKYTLKTVKQEQIGYITGAQGGDWGNELVYRELNKLSTQDVVKLKAEALSDMEENGEAPTKEPSSEAYKRAHRRYVENNASTQAEWDNYLYEEMAKEAEIDDTLLFYISRLLGIDIDGVRAAQAAAERDAANMQGDEKERFLRRKKREAFEAYRGV